MKLAVVTNYSPEIYPLAKLTSPNKQDYCLTHGYDFHNRCNPMVHFYGFERTWYVLKLLKHHDYNWVLSVGCDTVFTNFQITIESLIDDTKGFIIASDSFMIQNDVFLAKSCPRTIEFLERCTSLEKVQKYTPHPIKDQQAMADLMPEYSDLIKVVPQRTLNAYEYGPYSPWERYRIPKDTLGTDGNWQPGDFLFHSPGLPMGQRLELLARHLMMVKR